MSLLGFRPVDPAAPVTHVSYYEADAFARWAGHRLPSEFEWEVAAASVPVEGRTLGAGHLRPDAGRDRPAASSRCSAMSGNGREAPISPIPASRPRPGAVGEYNGKFMCNQFVLKGGSCVTPEGHVRRDLSQFLLSASALAVHGLTARGGRMMEGDVSLQLPSGSAAPSRALRAQEAPAPNEFAEAVLAGLRAIPP